MKNRLKITSGLSGAIMLGLMAPTIVFAVALAPPSLEKTKVPVVNNLSTFIERTDKAILLGKALFWDSQVGSDGQACASCHFHAGGDSRVKNQLSPGLRRTPDSDTTFQQVASGGLGGPNYTLSGNDFPFHKLTDPSNRNSAVIFSSNDIASSQGTFGGQFISIPDISQGQDVCDRFPDPIFHVGGIGTQRVEPRNTPTTINAVFNLRNFWDGRANNVFNGVDEFGLRSPNATVLRKTATGVVKETISLNNSSLASQAVGPPRSDLEMACTARAFAELGRKMLPRRALATQKVHPTDGVLGGAEVATTGVGLKKTYKELVQSAFKKEYWDTLDTFDGLTQMESNFSLFFGLAVQLYEATLISDKTPYDAFTDLAAQPFDPVKGKQAKLSPEQRRGLDVFLGKGNCIECHHGALFSAAATQPVTPEPINLFIERMLMGDGRAALYDVGFYNIGVTPTNEDIAVGGKDPFGNPLSFSEQLVTNNRVDQFDFNPCAFEVPFNAANCNQVPANLVGQRIAVRGAFKTPTLRNVALTGPYMHNGSMDTLEQVVDFYNRGGNFQNPELDAGIKPLGLTAQEKSDLVAFLHSLTDSRVVNESKPFDHPQLFVTNGHPGNEFLVDDVNADGFADSHLVELPAVGDKGLSGVGRPGLKPFLLADIESKVVNACLAGKPKSLTFAYTGQPCTATTNFQGGSLICTGSPNEAQPVQIVMTKEPGTYIPNPSTQSINIGDLVTIARNDGKTFSADIRLAIKKDGATLQSLIIKTDCTKPIYENDRFGSLLLETYIP